MNRHAGRNHQLVDARDTLVRVDEEPLPIQRNDLDLERRRLRCQRPGGIQVMRADPGHAAQQHDHQDGNGPDDELEPAGIGEIRQIGRSCVGGSEPPGEGKGRGDRRDHDGEHDGERVDQDRLVGDPDHALRVEDGRLTCGQRDRRGDRCSGGGGRYRNGRLKFWTTGSPPRLARIEIFLTSSRPCICRGPLRYPEVVTPSLPGVQIPPDPFGHTSLGHASSARVPDSASTCPVDLAGPLRQFPLRLAIQQ